MFNICDNCVQKNKAVLCNQCSRNSKYKDLRDYFIDYYPVCPMKYSDCIHDPAYIKFIYPEWHKELYGDKTVEEAVKERIAEGHCQVSCEYCSNYDDEDK